MNVREKALIAICVVMVSTVAYLSRDEVSTIGNGYSTEVHNRWTGSIVRCDPDGCSQVYPATR